MFICFGVYIFVQMLLLVGTKLQGIITKMCVDSHDKSHVVRGTLLVKPSDHFFWFGWPKLLLHILHFILYQVIDSSKTLFQFQNKNYGGLTIM